MPEEESFDVTPADEPSDEGQKEVWCPTCKIRVPLEDPELRVSFTPVAATVEMDGTIDLGSNNDWFLDYYHLLCGTRIRLVCSAIWDDELFEYIPSDAWVEIDVHGVGYIEPEEPRRMFSSSLAEDPAAWGPTMVVLLDACRKAVGIITSKLGGTAT